MCRNNQIIGWCFCIRVVLCVWFHPFSFPRAVNFVFMSILVILFILLLHLIYALLISIFCVFSTFLLHNQDPISCWFTPLFSPSCVIPYFCNSTATQWTGYRLINLISLIVKGLSNFRKRRTILLWCRKRNSDFFFYKKDIPPLQQRKTGSL